MRRVVTGGAGFIGSNLVDALLARGDEVVVVDDLSTGKRENVSADAQLLEVDIRSPALADSLAGAEAIFHLAAQADVPTSVRRPDFDAEVNVVGSVRVLQAAGDAPVVFSSTGGAIYGECERPAREDDPRRPLAPTASPSSQPRSTSPPGTACTGRATQPFGSGTCTGRGRRPA